VATILSERVVPHPHVRTAVTVGFVGAYTTFSTFAFETLRLAEEGAGGLATLNVVLSVLVGVMAPWGGVAVGRTR
jgi:CrcB protein